MSALARPVVTLAWRTVRFDQILRRVERKVELDDSATYDCAGVRWYGLGAFTRETLLGMQIKRKQQWVLRAGDVVYNKLFAWKGAFAIADEAVDGCIVSDKFPTYAADPTLVDIRYLGYYFHTPQLSQQATNLSKGAAAISKLTLNPPQFWDLTIPLPPLDEQRRIVGCIEELAARIAAAQGLRREAMAEAMALVPARLRELIGNPYEHIAGTLGPMRFVRLGEVVTDVADGPHVTPQYVDDGIPFVTAQNITSGRVDFTGTKFVTREAHEEYQKRAKAEPGDVLVTKDGTIGVPCFIDTQRQFSFFVSVALIKPRRDCLDGEYLTWIMRSPYLQERIRLRSRGDMIRHLVLREIKDLLVPIPTLSQQCQLVHYLNEMQVQIGKFKQLQAETAAELDALLPSVLDKAFRGGL